MNFFEFIYLDENLLDQFLGQIEGGVYDDERQKKTSEDKPSDYAFGRVKSGSFGESVGGKSESERVVRQTAGSKFARFSKYLEDSGSAVRVDDESENVWESLTHGSIVVADGVIGIPSIVRAMAMTEDFAPLLQTVQSFGIASQFDIDSEKIAAISNFQKLTAGKMVGTLESGAEDTTFVLKLQSENFKRDSDEFDGEATVVGRVLKKIPEGKSYSVFSVPGMDILSREARRQNPQPSDQAPDSEIHGPAISLSVLAVYR